MTIDLFIIRKLGLALRSVPQIATDVVGLVDEWAARFFEELDYQREGRNGTLFAQQMAADLPQVRARKRRLNLECSPLRPTRSSGIKRWFQQWQEAILFVQSVIASWRFCLALVRTMKTVAEQGFSPSAQSAYFPPSPRGDLQGQLYRSSAGVYHIVHLDIVYRLAALYPCPR